jgi:hypothetical protein
MRKRKTNQEALTLAILTFITISVWVGFEVYRAYTRTAVKPDVRHQLIPLDPKLNAQTLEKLEKRRGVSTEEIKEMASFPIESPEKETLTSPEESLEKEQAQEGLSEEPEEAEGASPAAEEKSVETNLEET